MLRIAARQTCKAALKEARASPEPRLSTSGMLEVEVWMRCQRGSRLVAGHLTRVWSPIYSKPPQVFKLLLLTNL